MENKKSLIINLICIFLYAAATLTIVLHHEIWADEAQVWLVVRDLNFSGIISHVRTEGHPLLWYFILLPFAKLPQANAVIMQLINWLVVVISVSVLLLKSPFNLFSKISILLSSGFLYWYAAISRSYCFILLFMFLIAAFYKKQKEHPFIYATLVILLANTHIIMMGFCTALAIIFLWNNRDKKSITAAGLMFASFACITLYLWGSQNENTIIQTDITGNFLNRTIYELNKAIYCIYNSINPLFTAIFYIFTVFAGITIGFLNRQMLFVYICSTIFQFMIYICVWGQIPQRTFLLFLVIVFCFWIVFKDCSHKLKNTINILIILAFLPSFAGGWYFIQKDMTQLFSDGKNTADFIKKNIPEDAFILSNFPLTTVSVSIYLPKDKWKFFYPGYQNYYTFADFKKISPSTVPLALTEYLKQRNDIYVIMSAGTFYDDIKPVYISSDKVFMQQEKYAIYHLTRTDFTDNKK